ncbi:cuticle protein CP14.6 isoform X2 [Aethina tumida]|uniref:cuticle protein CP14.6 isoform X2 n=1 Tax=Aethina tumida TaxID=116153 RepID=UPI00096AE386|nr:cuticle protein CP14.6 isoform X2 [Aethina tumida]
MKPVLLLFALVGVIYCKPQNDPRQAYITRYDSDNDGLGAYSYNVATSDGFTHDVKAEAAQGPEGLFPKVTGSYSYIGPDGVTYTVLYVADEYGFRAAGEHIPPAAHTDKKVPPLGIPGAAIASLAGGGLG